VERERTHVQVAGIEQEHPVFQCRRRDTVEQTVARSNNSQLVNHKQNQVNAQDEVEAERRGFGRKEGRISHFSHTEGFVIHTR
jgi:hypothetical protein